MIVKNYFVSLYLLFHRKNEFSSMTQKFSSMTFYLSIRLWLLNVFLFMTRVKFFCKYLIVKIENMNIFYFYIKR